MYQGFLRPSIHVRWPGKPRLNQPQHATRPDVYEYGNVYSSCELNVASSVCWPDSEAKGLATNEHTSTTRYILPDSPSRQ